MMMKVLVLWVFFLNAPPEKMAFVARPTQAACEQLRTEWATVPGVSVSKKCVEITLEEKR